MEFSIIVPAYKSSNILAEQLPVLIDWISNWQLKGEIIVVVDGGDQKSYASLSKLKDVKVIGYERNRGKGYAIVYGFEHTTAPLVIYTDADIPFKEESMLVMIDMLKKHNRDDIWVIGDRTLPTSVYFDDISFLRKKGSDLFLKIIKYTLGNHFADTQCGLKGFTRSAGALVFSKTKVHRFAFDFECLFIAKRLNLTVLKMPVQLRNQSASTVRIFADGYKMMKDVFKVLMINRYD